MKYTFGFTLASVFSFSRSEPKWSFLVSKNLVFDKYDFVQAKVSQNA